MKVLWLIPITSALYLVSSFVSEFHVAWGDRLHLPFRWKAAWRNTRWDCVLVAAIQGMIVGVALTAIKLFMF